MAKTALAKSPKDMRSAVATKGERAEDNGAGEIVASSVTGPRIESSAST
jgi:hypothetical protein